MKLVLRILLFVVTVAACLAEPNCSYDEMQKCLKYQPNPSSFMQTRKELEDFCTIFPQEIECMKDYDTRCGTMNPMMKNGYEMYKKMIEIMCEKRFRKTGTHTEPPHLMQHVDVVSALRLLVQQNKYLHYAPCLNKALGLTGEKCHSNEVPMGNEQERCTKIMDQLYCTDDVVEKECGRDALDVFKKIFHLTYKNFVVKPANCL